MVASGTLTRTKTGFPPSPKAPLRSTPRIGLTYSGALERNARGGMTPFLSPPRRRGSILGSTHGFPPSRERRESEKEWVPAFAGRTDPYGLRTDVCWIYLHLY